MRRPAPAFLLSLASSALLSLALVAPAQAGISAEGGGDYTKNPLYRAFLFGGIDRGGEGGYDFDDISGIDYVSNTAPKTQASISGSFSANGATMNLNGWSAWSGYYAARTFASMTVSNANAADTYYVVAGQGSTTSLRFYTPEAAADHATFTFRISGSESNPASLGASTARLDFAATTETGLSWNELFTGGLSDKLFVYGAGTYTYTLPIADLGQAINLYFWTSAYTEVRAGTFAQGSNFSMTADYGHTVVLEEVQLFTADEQQVSEWTLEDAEMGTLIFDQAGRIAEVLPAPVPEPGTWALMVAGLAIVLRVGRRAALRQS